MMLQVYSIFLSLDGEVNAWGQGVPSVFVRLSGCNLGDDECPWCDTKGSRDPKAGQAMTVEEVFQIIREYGCPKVTITGGEPLLQEDGVHQLLNRLFPYNYRVSIETNGTVPLGRFRNLTKPNPNVCLVVDWKWSKLKIPASEYENLAPWDWIKFVIATKEQYWLAVPIIATLKTPARIAFSPVHGLLEAKTLAEWILADQLWNVTLNLQLHKLAGLE